MGFILMKQKTNGEWDEMAKKMPPALRTKAEKVLKECRQNGFICPRVYDWKLKWSQVLGRERNMKYVCQCDLCDNNTTAGTCKGRFVKNHLGHRDFKPCWEK